MTMQLDLTELTKPREIRETIDDPRAGSFTVVFRLPTYAELLRQSDGKLWSEDLKYRFSFVIGWEGVTAPDGSPIPFSADNFAKAVEAYPSLLEQLAWASLRLFQGADRKNSPPPPVPLAATAAPTTSASSGTPSSPA